MTSDNSCGVILAAPPFEARGICAYTVRLARGLTQHEFRPSVVTPDARNLDRQIRSELDLYEWRFCDQPAWGPWLARLREMPESLGGAQLIHAQSPRMLSLALDFARRLQQPALVTVHHLGVGRRLRIDTHWCRRVIAASEPLAHELTTRGGVPSRLITVIPPGVEACPLTNACPPLDSSHVPVIGTAGPLEPGKGLPWFLGAAKLVSDAIPEVEFMIAGAGNDEANLRRLARDLGVASRVTFAPYVSDFRVSLEAMDIFCLPSVRQGLSAIMLEAMALGRPVVATSLGDINDVLEDGQNGLLAPPENVRALADRLLQLLRNPVQARALAEAGRARVARDFNVSTMISQTASVYREILQSSPVDHRLFAIQR